MPLVTGTGDTDEAVLESRIANTRKLLTAAAGIMSLLLIGSALVTATMCKKFGIPVDRQHILGHTQVKTTQRYAHLSQDTLLAAANAATVAVGAVMLPAIQQVAITPSSTIEFQGAHHA